MKFYSIQKLSAWKVAKEKGYLTGTEEYVDEYFHGPYTWMMEQMNKRLSNYKGEFPVWLWTDVSNICVEELIQDDFVLLEIELPEDEVLLSHFDAWNCVLNDWNMCGGNIETSEKESWKYIFDKNILEDQEFDTDDCYFQGVVGTIDCHNIKVLKYIVTNIDNL